MSLLGMMLGIGNAGNAAGGMRSFDTSDMNIIDPESHGAGGLTMEVLRQQLGREYHPGGGRMPSLAAPVAPENPFQNLPFMNDWGMSNDPSSVIQPDQNNPATWTPASARTMNDGLADQGFGADSEQAKAFAQLQQPAQPQSTTPPAQAQPTPQMVQAPAASPHDSPSNEMRRQSIRSIESDGMGGYQAVGKRTRTGDRAYGAYQVMGSNIGPWTEQVLGRRMSAQEFLANPAAQDKVFDEIFGEAVQKYGDAGAASVWFTGSPSPSGKKDVVGTVDTDYVSRYMQGLGQPLRYSNHENRHGTGEVVPGQPSSAGAAPGDAEFMTPRGQQTEDQVAQASGGASADSGGVTPEQIEALRSMSLKERLALLAQFMQMGGFKPGEGQIG